MTFPRRRAAALAVVAGLVAAACSDSILTEAAAAGLGLPTGQYHLALVNGRALPAETRNDATGRVVITAGQLAFSGYSFSQTLSITETPTGGAAASRQSVTQGTISVSGAVIHFRASDGGTWDGVRSGASIECTVMGNNGTVTFTFQQG